VPGYGTPDEPDGGGSDVSDRVDQPIGDPQAWGSAKTFAVAAREAGVDLTDSDQVKRFIHRYNDGLAA
jgi:hypothetical protein